jgi:excinuclease ABC subunit C
VTTPKHPADPRIEKLKARLAEIPERPGVYLHRSRDGEVIYVGKARSLRARVSSYIVGKGARDGKTMSLILEIDAIDFVVTNNELEAILLENNLIKQYQPRFNVLLRDDKSYPYLKVTMREDYPRVVFTRRVSRARGDQYFGPFFAGTARRMLKLIGDQFRLRTCDLEITEGKSAVARPCLYYDMHRCPGPCVAGLADRGEYMQIVDDVLLFLGGKSRELLQRLKDRMYAAAEAEQFEVARYFRDLIRTVEHTHSEQQVASAGDVDADIWGVWQDGGDVAVAVFVMRDGNLVDRKEVFWEKVQGYDPAMFLAEVIQRFYEDNLFIPGEVLVPVEIEDEPLVAEWLSSKRGRRVTIRVPKKGRAADLLGLATKNAKLSHGSRFRMSRQTRLETAASRLAELLGIDGEIRRIESFDISNIQGTDSVAGMVVYDSGRLDPKQYRLFNIKGFEGADDFRSIAEAVERRYHRLISEDRPLPDLILIDGGRGQLNAARAALQKLDAGSVPIAGLAKRDEEVYLPDADEPLRLERRDPALQLLQQIRDETHRFAITSHRKKRTRRTLTSELDTLHGVGEKRKRTLIEHFGSVSAVRQASSQDLAKVLGPRVGQAVWSQLHESSG